MISIFRYLIRESGGLFAVVALSGIVCGLSGAAIVKVISAGIAGGPGVGQRAYLFFGLCALYLATKSCSEILLIRLTQRVVFVMRLNLSHRVLVTPFRKLQALGKGELLAILTHDIGTFMQAFQLMPLAFSNAILILVCFLYMAWLSWQSFLIFVAFLLVCTSAYHLVELGLLRKLELMREHMKGLYEHFRGLVEGTKELQLNARRGRSYVDNVIATRATFLKELLVTTMTGYTWILNIGAVLFYLSIGLLLFVIAPWMGLRAEVVTVFALILLFLIRPISEIMTALPPLRQARVAFRRIQQMEGDLAASEPAVQGVDPFGAQQLTRIELDAVCYRYARVDEDGRFAFGPINLAVEPGEILFIIGGNGSGKTTLAMLLLAFYQPDAGQIKLNGVQVDESNLHFYRQRFSAVFTDFHLFEQVAFADEPELCDRASAYIEALGMAHNVKLTDGRFSTVNLSTGQRKRLALVASYLEDRPVYLFDEWAADQDPAFKRIFYTALLPELKARGKTIIVITHDDAYFTHADRVIKLENGVLDSRAVTPESWTRAAAHVS